MTAINAVTDLSIEDGIAILTLNSPPVNALSGPVMDGIHEALLRAMADPAIAAMVLICAGRTFMPGADLKTLSDPAGQPKFPFNETQALAGRATKPLVAAIHGTALGGGLEVAMGMHYRVAVPSARFGLPEVKIGLLPAGGGTQQLTRLVGAVAALDLMTTGDQIDTMRALAIGLIDALVPEDDLRQGALAFTRRILDEKRPLKRIRDLDDKTMVDRSDPGLFESYRKTHARRLRRSEAADAIIRAVEAAVTLPFEDGLATENKLYHTLIGSAQNKALMYNFFAERQAAKIPDIPRDTPLLPLKRVAVIGTGPNARGIALACAEAGLLASLVAADKAALDTAIAALRPSYDGALKRGRVTHAFVDEALARVTGSTQLQDVHEADLIIEATPQDLATTLELFTRLDSLAKPDAILANSTARFDLNEIAASTAHPDRVVGMHFFAPINTLKLIEVFRGARTSKTVVATVMKFANQIGKIPVLAGICPGFIANRMVRARLAQAERLVLEGADVETVDRVLTDFGMPLGPFALADVIGLDTGWSAATSTGSTLREVLCEAGRYGQKTDAGYYDYDSSRKARPSPQADAIIRTFARRHAIAQRAADEQEMLASLMFATINEGAKILDEGIALRASDIDVVWINGYGFPAFRGGPMHYASTLGLGRVLAGLEELESRYGEALAPSPLLRRLVEEGRDFPTS